MLKVLLARLHQRHRTLDYPAQTPAMPDRFRGAPIITSDRCPAGCSECADACPTRAIACEGGAPGAVDLGRCLFCTDCAGACPHGALVHGDDFRLASRTRDGLVTRGAGPGELATALDREARRLFGRSLRLRQVSAGGCNACEADTNVLGTPVFDLGRFGIQFVASPRHADGLLVTGPVTANMELALRKTYDAVPAPKIVVAVGACAISGGPFAGNAEVRGGAGSVVPVDLHVPGCPPHPWTILDGLLRLLGRM